MVDINNSGVGTQVAEPVVAETPNLGQAEATEVTEVEQAQTETDNTVVEPTPENYKKLQAEFTRKSQEYANKQKQWDKDAQELATFRQMQTEQAKQTQTPQPGKPLSAKEFANLEPMEQLNYLVDQRVTEIASPLQQKITQLESYIARNIQQESQRTWNEFVEQHPDALNMAGDIAQVIAQHNMPLDKAYKFLKADQALPEAKQEVLKEIQVKKDASKLMKPVTTPTTPVNAKVSSFEEAWEKTQKELGIK